MYKCECHQLNAKTSSMNHYVIKLKYMPMQTECTKRSSSPLERLGTRLDCFIPASYLHVHVHVHARICVNMYPLMLKFLACGGKSHVCISSLKAACSCTQGTSLDPLLDDSIAMAQKLQSVNQPVTLNVIENVPHGFLCFRSAGNDQDLEGGQRLCVSYIKQGLSIP